MSDHGDRLQRLCDEAIRRILAMDERGVAEALKPAEGGQQPVGWDLPKSQDATFDGIAALARKVEENRRAANRNFPDRVNMGRIQLRIIHVGDRSEDIRQVVMHPMAMAMVARNFTAPGLNRMTHLYGAPVTTSEMVDPYGRRWITRPHPWVVYDDADEVWSRPIGYGREVADETTIMAYAIRATPPAYLKHAELPDPVVPKYIHQGYYFPFTQ